ncbi:hypothetical protein EYZ11_012763 [Aspergillus tanneri]|uniref:Uncharacterized protein n=1 Tax=Aspergillus tanneri TaxID=1220188 RepID=A0A4S3IZX6_9EURO|nr:hypothetical protein EYZ11_012763 [Aspergillus tanneri]
MASTDDPITLTSLSGRRKRNIVQGEAKRIQVDTSELEHSLRLRDAQQLENII